MNRITNTSPSIAVAPLAIIAIQSNFDCSILITQDEANQPAGTGWQVLLANPFNSTDVRVIHRVPFVFLLLFCSYSQALWAPIPRHSSEVAQYCPLRTTLTAPVLSIVV